MKRNFRQFAEISKVEDQDDGTIMVYGVAQSGGQDHAGETILPSAMKAALPDYSKFPALREMHNPSAAGRVPEAYVDDDGLTAVVAHVVDPIAITKVKTGVYAGFSIGGKVLKRDPSDRSIITELRLVEISLVDSPCNPDAVINMWKADMSNYNPSGDEVVAEAKILAEAAGSKKFKDFLYKAREALIAKAVEADLGDDDEVTEAVEEVAPVAEVVEPIEPAEAAAEAEKVEVAEEAIEPVAEAAPDPVAALDAVIERAAAVIAPVETEAPGPFADLAKAAGALRLVQIENPLTKSLWQVGILAEIMERFQCVAANIVYEANSEKDGSPQPAMAQEAMKTLGALLVQMATEEVAEAIAGLPEIDPPIIVIMDGDDAVIALANQIIDTVKADTDLMEKAGARNSKGDAAKIQSMHDNSVALGATCDTAADKVAGLEAENERLAKALVDGVPQVEELRKSFETQISALNKRLEEVAAQPAAPKTLAGPLRAVTKTEDISPGAASDAAPMTAEDFTKALNSLPEHERGELLLRFALSQPKLVQPARAAA